MTKRFYVLCVDMPNRHQCDFVVDTEQEKDELIMMYTLKGYECHDILGTENVINMFRQAWRNKPIEEWNDA